MASEERTRDRQAEVDEHLDPVQDADGGEAAPGPAQRSEPAPATGEDVRNTGSETMSEADRPATGRS